MQIDIIKICNIKKMLNFEVGIFMEILFRELKNKKLVLINMF